MTIIGARRAGTNGLIYEKENIVTTKKKTAVTKPAASKKKAISKTATAAPVDCCYREKRSVRITEADNGFSVSTYGPKGEEIMVAKSSAEAMRHCKTLLASGKK